MALDRQIDFSGGLNTRIPAHKLPENMVQAATNTDFTHGDVRPDTGIGGDGGGRQFYYEKGDSWVGTDVANAYTILTVDAGDTSTATIPSTDLGNPLTVSATGTYQIGVVFTFTAVAATDVITTSATHGLVNDDTVVLTTTGTLPAGLALATTYYVLATPAVNTLTLAAVADGTIINITNTGSGTHTLTSVTSVTVNDTELNLGSVTSFVEYNDDLYMGRENFSLVATTLVAQTGLITLTAADIAKVITSDGVVGFGIPLGAKIENVNTGTNVITIDKTITVGDSDVTLTIETSPARIIDGVLTKIYPVEIPKPVPHSAVVSQLSGNNTTRFEGHSIKWVTDNYPIPLQWGIARFDDTTGAEGGISELTPIGDSLSNINSDSTHTSVPAMVKFKINKQDANSLSYGKFALYRVGGTSSVIKKVQDIYLTSQSDGSPLSVLVAKSTNNVNITTQGIPTGAEWKVKWFGYGGTGARRSYHSGGITSITIAGTNDNYGTDIPTLTIAAPGGTGKTATAIAVLTGTSISNVIITDKGSGYTGVPTVTIARADTSTGNATATAVIESASYTGESSWLSTTSLISIYGSDPTHAVDLHFMTKFTSENISPITGFPYRDDTREYLFASTNLVNATTLGDNGGLSHDGCGSIIDFTPPRALIEIEPIQNPMTVPFNMKYLTEFNNFFMGAVDTRLHISNYAKPNSYSIDGYLDFDGNITGIVSRGGEAVVFTERGVYRVYGNAHNEMRKVQVPTTHGIPLGGHKTISKIKDSIIYASHTGICLFNGRNVNVLTDALIQNFAKPSGNALDNVSGVIDDTYYLLSDADDGWKVDLKQSPKICKSTGRASNFHYRSSNNRLYTEGGYIGGGSENRYSFETRDFTGGNITAEKAYYTVYVTGTDFSGTINIKCDGVLSDTFTFGSPLTEFNRALSLATAIVANRASIEFVDCSGQITSVAVKYDNLAEQQKKRFNFVTFTYTGTPTVTVKVDSVQRIASTVLTDPGTGNTGTSILYFPAMTEGHVPHIIADETETSRISGSVFDAEVI
jgi:hypothetical protein